MSENLKTASFDVSVHPFYYDLKNNKLFNNLVLKEMNALWFFLFLTPNSPASPVLLTDGFVVILWFLFVFSFYSSKHQETQDRSACKHIVAHSQLFCLHKKLGCLLHFSTWNLWKIQSALICIKRCWMCTCKKDGIK